MAQPLDTFNIASKQVDLGPLATVVGQVDQDNDRLVTLVGDLAEKVRTLKDQRAKTAEDHAAAIHQKDEQIGALTQRLSAADAAVEQLSARVNALTQALLASKAKVAANVATIADAQALLDADDNI